MAKILVVDEPLSVAAPVADVVVEAPGEPIEDAKSVLSRLAAVPGVTLAVLVDREGFLIESAGDLILEAEAAGALACCLAEASEATGRELGQGALVGLTAEYEAGLILVNRAASGTMLATVVSDPAVLDRARHDVKKTLSDLLTLA
jgi:predicted regulator of Ras-like GTPase activity (Roadblock/LC7/MglB family)